MTAVRVIYGTINENGSTSESGGFVSGEGTALTGRVINSERISKGVYDIVFIDEFGAVPSVTVTQIYNNNGKPGNTKDNAVIVNIKEGSVRIATGNDDGHLNDRNFSFQAMGLDQPIR